MKVGGKIRVCINGVCLCQKKTFLILSYHHGQTSIAISNCKPGFACDWWTTAQVGKIFSDPAPVFGAATGDSIAFASIGKCVWRSPFAEQSVHTTAPFPTHLFDIRKHPQKIQKIKTLSGCYPLKVTNSAMKGSNQGNFLRRENKFPSSSFPTSIAISLFLAAFISPCPQSDNSLYHGTDFAWWPYLLPSPCLLGILSPAQRTLATTVPTASSSCSELNLSFINRMSSNRNCSRRIIPGQSSPCGIYCKCCLWTAAQLDLARVCLSHLTFPPKWRRGQ